MGIIGDFNKTMLKYIDLRVSHPDHDYIMLKHADEKDYRIEPLAYIKKDWYDVWSGKLRIIIDCRSDEIKKLLAIGKPDMFLRRDDVN